MMTIGHSTLPLEVFIQGLKDNGCRLLVDVRSIPRSRHNPQFEQSALFASLEAAERLPRSGEKRSEGGALPARTASTEDGATKAFVVMPTTCRPLSSPHRLIG